MSAIALLYNQLLASFRIPSGPSKYLTLRFVGRAVLTSYTVFARYTSSLERRQGANSDGEVGWGRRIRGPNAFGACSSVRRRPKTQRRSRPHGNAPRRARRMQLGRCGFDSREETPETDFTGSGNFRRARRFSAHGVDENRHGLPAPGRKRKKRRTRGRRAKSNEILFGRRYVAKDCRDYLPYRNLAVSTRLQEEQCFACHASKRLHTIAGYSRHPGDDEWAGVLPQKLPE